MPYLDNDFSIDNVEETMNEIIESPESKKVPPGTWRVQVLELRSKEFYDDTDEYRTQVKRLIPLEVIDEGEYNGSWIWCSIYMPPENDDDWKQMYKYKTGRKRLALLAHACGQKSITDLNQMQGKLLKVTLAKGEKSTYVDITAAAPVSGTPPAPKDESPIPASVPIKDEVPF